MEEEQYKKEMRSLEKIKAPDDFLGQVIARLDKVSLFERIKQFFFVPLRVKIPLQLAAAVTTIIVIFSVYRMAQPAGQITYMAPRAKMERALKKAVVTEDKAKVSRRAAQVARSPASLIKEEKPIEFALLIKAEQSVMAAAPSEMAMGPVSGARMGAEELETKDRSFPAPTSDSVAQVRELVKNTRVNILSIDSEKNIIVLEIPSDKYDLFLANLKQLGELEGPLSIKTENKVVRLQIKILLLE